MAFNYNKRTSVFIGNISYQATEKQMVDICEEIGPVVSFRFIMDKKSGKRKGYGFCTYLDEETALSACRNLKGCLVRGRELLVNLAKDGKCTDITRNQGQHGSWVGSNLGTAQHPSGTTPAVPPPPACQPLGLSAASAGLSATVGAIEGTQSGMAIQEESDPLTSYLARLSKRRLQELSSEIKLLAADDNQMVRELVQQNPILMRAQLQADIMLGITTPVKMQMASSQQFLSQLGQMPQQSIPTVSVQPIHVPVLHQAPACTNPSQISCSSQVCAKTSNGLQTEVESWTASGHGSNMVPWNQGQAGSWVGPNQGTAQHPSGATPTMVPVLQQQVPITPGMPFHAPASTDGSQFSYSRWVSAAAETPVDLPTVVKSWSELQPTKIRKLA